jgi:hypothetical protein
MICPLSWGNNSDTPHPDPYGLDFDGKGSATKEVSAALGHIKTDCLITCMAEQPLRCETRQGGLRSRPSLSLRLSNLNSPQFVIKLRGRKGFTLLLALLSVMACCLFFQMLSSSTLSTGYPAPRDEPSYCVTRSLSVLAKDLSCPVNAN